METIETKETESTHIQIASIRERLKDEEDATIHKGESIHREYIELIIAIYERQDSENVGENTDLTTSRLNANVEKAMEL